MNDDQLQAWAEYAEELEAQFLADYEREMRAIADCDCDVCFPVPACEVPTWGCSCGTCDAMYAISDQRRHALLLRRNDKQYGDAPRRRRVPMVPRRERTRRRAEAQE